MDGSLNNEKLTSTILVTMRAYHMFAENLLQNNWMQFKLVVL